jgi:predicted AlkP superfamily pyrophosphatase or phosphodiesterase
MMPSSTPSAPGVPGLPIFRPVLALGLALTAILAGAPPAAVAEPAAPRLYVIVSVDQMRADYLERYGHMWTKGLRRLVDGGASFTQSTYAYMNTVTCAGHATIGTGTNPATHGMVLNQWFDRESQRLAPCTDDPGAPLLPVVGPAADGTAGNSGRRLLVPTFADELRAQSGVAPRIVSLSLKPRSAIAMAGHRGDLVLWFDAAHGWTTSRAFSDVVPAWLVAHAGGHSPDADYGKAWTRLLPESRYLWDDNAVGEGTPNGWARTFPHELTSKSGVADREFRAKWEDTPLADAALTGLAKAALDQLQLGKDASRRDVLAVSYSVLDHVGHAFGPRSHEVQDVLARLDVTIGDLIDHLDRTVGRERYVLAFTGDHGVSPIPEQMSTFGIDAGRVVTAQLREQVDQALTPFFGPGPHLAALAYTDIYFVAGRYEAMLANPPAMRAAIAALESVPGVAKIYRGDHIRTGQFSPDDWVARAIAAGYHPARSGDLLLVPRAYWITSGAIATHGTAYHYDSRVPLIFYGASVKAGRYPAPSSPADIAPTFAHLAGVTLPRPDGRVLHEAFVAPVAAVPAPRPGPPPSRP